MSWVIDAKNTTKGRCYLIDFVPGVGVVWTEEIRVARHFDDHDDAVAMLHTVDAATNYKLSMGVRKSPHGTNTPTKKKDTTIDDYDRAMRGI